MKTLSRDKERHIENYIHKHHSMWTIYFLCGRQKIKFSLAHEINYYKSRAEDEANNPPRILRKEYQIMNRDRHNFFIYLYEKFDGNDIEALNYWVERGKYHRMLVRSNVGRPVKESRDNKGVKVGSGGGNKNKIRYPKKCRKTAWKRFYKLFPNLDPKNKEI